MSTTGIPQVTDSAPVPPSAELTRELARRRRGQLRIIADRFFRNRVAVVGLVVLLLIGLTAVLAPVILHFTLPAISNPSDQIDLNNFFASPSLHHPLGTDDLGRDELARVLYGARVSLLVGLASMAAALVIGIGIGAVAGFYGGLIDNALMRIVDTALSIPAYLILFVLATTFVGSGEISNVIFIIAALSWPGTARLVRGTFLEIKQREFILAARTLGAGDARIMFRHILPNAAGPIIVAATLTTGGNIIFESVLSFFGFGLHPPQASLGSLLAISQDYFVEHPLLLYVPGLLIVITVLSLNLMGDGLRDALDPYMTER
jgi:peptide/nickel transport system permease protein